jgi:hypothetical protein
LKGLNGKVRRLAKGLVIAAVNKYCAAPRRFGATYVTPPIANDKASAQIDF